MNKLAVPWPRKNYLKHFQERYDTFSFDFPTCINAEEGRGFCGNMSVKSKFRLKCVVSFMKICVSQLFSRPFINVVNDIAAKYLKIALVI